MRTFFSILLILVLGCAVFAQSSLFEKDGFAVNHTGTFLDGSEFELEDFKGKVIVINLWYVACPPCVKEIPELNKLVREYKNEEVIFLALAVDRAPKLEKFLKWRSFKYAIVPDSLDIIRNSYGRSFDGKTLELSFPTHIVIDRDFRVVSRSIGSSGIKVLRKALREQFSEQDPKSK